MGYKHSRQDLLDAAVDVTLESGIALLTFSAVGHRLGISDRTVVYYFATKDELVLAVLESLGQRLRELLEKAFGHAPAGVLDLQRVAWPVLASRSADPVFAVYFEVVGLASARTSPYDAIGPRLVDGWVEWLAPRVLAESAAERRHQALAAVATLDGLLLLRRISGARAANAAARQLGVLVR